MTVPQTTTIPAADLDRMCHDLAASAAQYTACSPNKVGSLAAALFALILFAIVIVVMICYVRMKERE